MKHVWLVAICSVFLYSDNIRSLEALSDKQVKVLEQAYELGKPFNLGYSLAAIAWRESTAGKYQINISDPSCGIFHNNLKTVLARGKVKDTSWNRNVACQKLLDYPEYAASEAIAELEYWMTVHGKDWNKIWASYNGGWRYESSRPQSYSKDIANKVQVLKPYFSN